MAVDGTPPALLPKPVSVSPYSLWISLCSPSGFMEGVLEGQLDSRRTGDSVSTGICPYRGAHVGHCK